jgi:hypothetical protein
MTDGVVENKVNVDEMGRRFETPIVAMNSSRFLL